MDAAPPIGHRKLRSPSAMPDCDSYCSNFRFRIFASLILVISVAYFSSEAPGFVSKSVISIFQENFHLLVIGIVVCYGFIGRRGVGQNVEMEMSLGFRASLDYMSEVLNVELMRDFDFELGRYGDVGIYGSAVVTDLGDEWLGLPVRSLKSVDGDRNGDRSFCSGCVEACGEGDRAFGELSPLNLLEKFNEASGLLKGRVASGSDVSGHLKCSCLCNYVPSSSSLVEGFTDCFGEC